MLDGNAYTVDLELIGLYLSEYGVDFYEPRERIVAPIEGFNLTLGS
jgi:hypothetical protein